ncbi:hypothetical protein AB0B83_01855 [Micromonospora sp. NPDC049060]|uniref:hypothetical protein n=1 Tax=Micromonospora sp. NPDC049060 TaxID=3154828 RepID=UPI00340BB2F8
MGLNMDMLTFTVELDGITALNEVALLDAIWVHTRPADRVEHIRVRAGPSRISVALFLIATDAHDMNELTDRIRQRIKQLPTFPN